MAETRMPPSPEPTERAKTADTNRLRQFPAPAAESSGDRTRADTRAQAEARSWRRALFQRPWLSAAVAIAFIAIVAALVVWWLNARHFEDTDDAFIDARTVALSSQVTGVVTEVDVTDNQHVESGAVMIRIDPRDFQAQVQQAAAQIAQANAGIANYEAQIAAQDAAIEQADRQVAEAAAALKFSKQESDRYQDLFSKGAGTAQRAQQASSDLQQKQAALDAAAAASDAAKKQVGVLHAQRDNAVAQRDAARAAADTARANLDRTRIVAPAAGRVTKLSAGVGALATPGQALMMFVPDDIWITANFKETQLTDMRPGQPVSISIDAYPGRELKGHVDSIQAGSGTAFALLPAENATGNYVKIVQRVPVKIVFDEKPDVLLGPGMSVVPSVRVR
jgi:membrane fusion protein (multidrug efflux system)